MLAIIPARGGSKGIKLKNIQKIGKNSLISNIFNRLKQTKSIQKIVCSTDNKKIIKECINLKIPYLKRKKKLSTDKANINDVIYDLLLDKKFDEFHYIILAQPTNPFINKKILEKIIKKIKNNKFKSVQTIIETPHVYHPLNQRNLIKNKVVFAQRAKREIYYNKQKKTPSYSFGNLVIFDRKKFLEIKKVFCEPSGFIKIDKIYGLDIDFNDDLILANLVAKTFKI